MFTRDNHLPVLTSPLSVTNEKQQLAKRDLLMPGFVVCKRDSSREDMGTHTLLGHGCIRRGVKERRHKRHTYRGCGGEETQETYIQRVCVEERKHERHGKGIGERGHRQRTRGCG
ncbi:hypothetical protein Pcinc_039882 [Petrolisthes cinctipes]|uniref:Uncharacterized protein n=1 Tax=Petrolisthes cinctipes TaxID=88211 RepID=A0AAE1ELD6_PETCI|nr:hypothetical protein Pcinc_039882 [Petrolisthes cinctipes]